MTAVTSPSDMRLSHTCAECHADIDTQHNESQNSALANHWDSCDAAIARGIRYTQALTRTNKGEETARKAEQRIAERQ